ncbi:MAG: HD domain-containing protein [Lachnospiraceae bacterium]|nr:HD domain-containing protein [Lachnospiraceae bacterium]
MKLDLTDMLCALSFALDKVEIELLGLDTGHSKRVAGLALLMGKEAGFAGEELRDFVGCCILHDNALTEFIHEELSNRFEPQDLAMQFSDITVLAGAEMNCRHCVIGEQNIRLLPFRTDVKDIILYHHENADGSGALGKTDSETTLKSQILHLADVIDMTSRLNGMAITEFEELRRWVRKQSGGLFSGDAVELFLRAVNFDRLLDMQEGDALTYFQEEIETTFYDYSDGEIRNIAGLFAKIVDYKSAFTQAHSRGVAEKAEVMAHYYGFDREKAIRYYFAGAMHDIGKLVISNDILEKPGKLSDNEFAEMKNHAAATHYILCQIKGISDIVKWASNHHEKLNGTGYPQGLTEQDLSFEERLMTCIDIYQALTEKRPYKDGMSHEQAISIMSDMANNGEISQKIVQDMSAAMGTCK